MSYLYLFFLFVSLAQYITVNAMGDILSPSTLSRPSFLERNKIEEGFGPSTLVPTDSGCKRITELALSDRVVGYHCSQEEILGIKKGIAAKYVKICIENTTICAGCKQQFCVFPDCTWVTAESLEVGVKLLDVCAEYRTVSNVEIIYEPIVLHALTVEGHTFSVMSYGLLVHNTDAMILGASALALEYITIANPVVVLLGAGILLSTVAHQAYEAYIQQQSINNENISDLENCLPREVRLAERCYYEQRKTKLDQLKNELIQVKNGLGNIKVFCRSGFTSFTDQFLQYFIQQMGQAGYFSISASQELQLSEKKQKDLSKLREAELKILEKDIFDIQVALALHVNELIVQVDEAFENYDKAVGEINAATKLWNNQRRQNRITKNTALRLYEAEFHGEHLVNSINERVTELKFVAQYYSSCIGSMCIKEFTNIISTLHNLGAEISEHEKWVSENKQNTCGNIAIVEQYFKMHRIPFIALKNNIKNALEKQRKSRNAQALKNAKVKHSRLSAPGGPKKDDDEDDDNSKNDINKETLKIAEQLGFKRTNHYSHGQSVFQKGNRFISRDVDVHNGGFWKMADSIKNLARKQTRLGTYDRFLNRIGD